MKNDGDHHKSNQNAHINSYYHSQLYNGDCRNHANLPDEVSDGDIYISSTSNRRLYSYAGLIGVAVLFGTFLVTDLLTNKKDDALLKNVRTGTTVTATDFVISHDDYGEFNRDINKYPFLADSQLIEPYRRSRLSIVSNSEEEECSYAVTVLNAESTEERAQILDAGKITVEMDANDSRLWYLTTSGVGYFTVSITSICGDAVSSSESGVWSKYVRRELSALTIDDRASPKQK